MSNSDGVYGVVSEQVRDPNDLPTGLTRQNRQVSKSHPTILLTSPD